LNKPIGWRSSASHVIQNKKANKSSIEKKQQHTYKDTGFCSSINQTRNGMMDGVAEPHLKLETRQEALVVDGYVSLSKFVLTNVA
jgi:hypothetical protein